MKILGCERYRWGCERWNLSTGHLGQMQVWDTDKVYIMGTSSNESLGWITSLQVNVLNQLAEFFNI